MERPLPDRLELLSPSFTRLVTRATLILPGPLRGPILKGAFDRARDAFNRGDLDVVFAAFSSDVEYQPLPALPNPAPVGRGEGLGGGLIAATAAFSVTLTRRVGDDMWRSRQQTRKEALADAQC